MSAHSGLLSRVVTALVVLPALFALIWIPKLQVGFTLFVCALAVVALREVFALARAKDIATENVGGVLAGLAITLSAYLANPALTGGVLYGGCALVCLIVVLRAQISLAAMAVTVFGLVYVNWFAAHFIFLHRIESVGPGLVTILLVSAIATDTAAYFVGKSIGRHKMAPSISPNKTWEGAIGGLVFSVLGLALVFALATQWEAFAVPDWSLARYAITGALLSVMSQLGDLVESTLKRDAGVKDSGTAFPGHGGVLDRCDGLLFAAPVLYYMSV